VEEMDVDSGEVCPDLKLMHEKTKRQKLEASMQREWVSREKRESIAKAPRSRRRDQQVR
jgi:hypothetical protein